MIRSFAAAAFIIAIVLFKSYSFSVYVKDFKPVSGAWTGIITYKDHTSGKPFSMPASLAVEKDSTNEYRLILRYSYPQEPVANGNNTLVLSPDGKQINGELVVSKERDAKGILKVVTEKTGMDGNDDRKAILKHIYFIGKKTFIIRKEVTLEGEDEFMMRNEYTMSR